MKDNASNPTTQSTSDIIIPIKLWMIYNRLVGDLGAVEKIYDDLETVNQLYFAPEGIRFEIGHTENIYRNDLHAFDYNADKGIVLNSFFLKVDSSTYISHSV